MKQNESSRIKTAVITGTTSGIGYEFCKLFANDGYRLILVARNEQALRLQKEQLMQNGVKVEYICSSLEQTGAVEYVFDKIGETKWKIDVLVNNAGFSEANSFWETDIQKELEMIQLHISFMTELTKLLLIQMIEHKSGKILNIGSTGSYIPCPNSAVYGATKAYILSFSNALYAELKQTGVTITTLCPGSTATAFARKARLENTLLFQHSVMTAEKVAKIGYKAMKTGKRTVTAGFMNKLMVFSARLLPTGFISMISKKMMERKNLF